MYTRSLDHRLEQWRDQVNTQLHGCVPHDTFISRIEIYRINKGVPQISFLCDCGSTGYIFFAGESVLRFLDFRFSEW
jgi:hypothetical protein